MFNKVDKKNIFTKFFLTFGLILSGSTTGLFLVIYIWFVYLYRLIRSNQINFRFQIIFIFLLFAIIILMFNSSTGKILIERTFKNGSAIEGRFFNVAKVFFEKVSFFEFFFGIGNDALLISERYGWIPDFLFFYKCYGFSGVIIWLYCTFTIVKARKGTTFFYLILILSITIGANCIMNYMIFIFLPYLIKGLD